MTKSAYFRLARLVPLLMLLSACAGEEPYDEPGQIQSTGGYLAEGRLVQIKPAGFNVGQDGKIPQFDPRGTAPGINWDPSFNGAGKDSWLDLIAASCDYQTRSVYGNNSERAKTSLRACPAGDCSNTTTLLDANGLFAGNPTPVPLNPLPPADENSPIRGWTTKYSPKPFITQAVLLCTGERLLEMAKSLVPTVFRGRETAAGSGQIDWVVAGYEGTDWPQYWKDHEALLQNSATTNNRRFALPDLSKFKVLFTVPPPSADEAATWALLAIDFFRESAILGAHGLSNYNPSALQYTAQLRDGGLVTHEQMMLGNLNEALTSMEDAAKFAERYAGAPNPDYPDTTPENIWRERLRSRLEAARTFTAVPASSFEGHSLIPLYQMTNGTTGEVVETTDPSVVVARWGAVKVNQVVLAWIYPPGLSPPVGAEPLYQYEKVDGNGVVLDSVVATTDEATRLFASSSPAYTKGAVQGFVLPTTDPTLPALTALRLVVTGTAPNVTYKAQINGTTAAQETIGYVHRPTLKANNYPAPNLAGKYPVVSTEALSQTSKDRIAEKKMRHLRVSPICLKGHPYCPGMTPSVPGAGYSVLVSTGGVSACSCANYGDIDVDRIILDMYSVEKASLPVIGNTNSYPAIAAANEKDWLKKQPFGAVDVKIAARRIAEEARVLGRSIEPLGANMQKLTTQVLMVAGTQRDYRAVEPAFLQAQTDGEAKQLSGDPEDATGLTISGTMHPRLTSAFARRGVYHAALFVRKALVHYTATSQAQATLAKLRTWLDQTVDGWMRVQVSASAVDANTTDYSLTVTERETTDTPGVYETWKGEAGLECALTGSVSGLACNENNYRIGTSANGSAALRVASGTWRLSIPDQRLRSFRAYVTKNAGRARRGIGGFTIPLIPAGKTEITALPILSSALNDAYARTLAADPTASYRANQFCGDLIDYDVRVKLSDEITRAQGATGELSDSVEYYLKRAETAATRADSLGNDIVEFGLQMDTRAEQGIEALEDLCGVSVDANPLSEDDNITAKLGQAGLDSCKAGEKDLSWVSAGTVGHCAWRIETDPNNPTPPCDCNGIAACEAIKKTAAQACPSLPVTADSDCRTHFSDAYASIPGIKYFAFPTLGNSVNQSSQGESGLTDIPAKADRPKDFQSDSIRGHCDMLAALYAGKYNGSQAKNSPDRSYTLGEFRNAFPWLDFDEVRNVAVSIGWTMDPYGRAALTLNGEPWLSVGSFAPNESPGIEPIARTLDVPNRQSWPLLPNQTWQKPAGCSMPNTNTAGLLVCSGAGESNGSTVGIRHAMRAYEALDALEHLTGAAGPRQGWSQLTDLDMLAKVGVHKQYVYETEPISSSRPEYSLFAHPTSAYVYWANVDDKEEYFVTDKHPQYEVIPWFNQAFFPNGPRDPWNWYGAAAFLKESTEQEIDQAYDADEFSNSSTLWETVRNPKGGDHTVVEWSYKAKRSGWKKFWRGAGRRWVETQEVLTRQQVFDAFSLVCMAMDKQEGIRPSADSCANFFPATPTMLDAANAADCVADQLNKVINRLYVPGVPTKVIDVLKAHDTVQVLPEFSGQYAETLSALGAELGVYQSTTQAVGRSVNELGYHTRTILRTIDKIQNELKISDIELKKDIANQITACISAVAENGGVVATITSQGQNQMGVAAVCANAAAQSVWSAKINDLKKENLNIDEDQALDDFQEQIHDVMARVDEQIEELRRSHAAVHAHIAALDSIRRQAARAEARATLSVDAGQGRVNHVNAVMRARMNTTLNRYERAFDQAVRYGYLARRAIEERVGLTLDEITKESSLTGDKATGGEAPYQWAEQICTMKGIDYQAIAGHLKDEDGNTVIPKDGASYDSTYVGDYIVRLRDFLDSYRFDYPFQDGSDTVVVSLRDELQGIRSMDCSIEGQNVLLDTVAPSTATGVWACNAPNGVNGAPPTNCPALRPDPNDYGPFKCNNPLSFCPKERAASRVSLYIPSKTLDTGIQQQVFLSPGTYTLSWFERCGLGAPLTKVRVVAPGVSTNPAATDATCTCAGSTGCLAVVRDASNNVEWVQRTTQIAVNAEGNHKVGFALPAVPSGAPARLAAIQLERGTIPTGYFPTTTSTSAPLGICEDVGGEGFRSWDNWTYRCETYCPAGTGNSCTALFPNDTLPQACYYETRFSISQELIERGRQITQAGFARGNFNYRIDELALNFVGTGVRTCDGAELQSACYGGSFLQYSLEHVGPYRVRNHDGDLYAARLFTGRIQQGKGVAAERYFTNPLSGADRELASEYMRQEMKGRPLDGTYILRVYDNEALQWQHLEDIQLLMKYQYWTRLD